MNEASSGSPEAEAEADGAFEWYRARSEFAAIGFDSALRAAFSSLRGTPRIGTAYCSEHVESSWTNTLIP